ncbi:hypothetical protein H7097_04020 [Aeromicrobium sp.]|nr:hypothetical protein [Candidatus Saccharibacteria bacterium]
MRNQPPNPELSLKDSLAIGATTSKMSHSEKWKGLTAEDSAFARAAIVKANLLRSSHADPGDAYLQAVADMTRFNLLSKVAEEVMQEVRAMPEYVEVNPPINPAA